VALVLGEGFIYIVNHLTSFGIDNSLSVTVACAVDGTFLVHPPVEPPP
jgi:hypothetical protein